MKMNKLAAGALALALGLGAVAPAVASEHGTRVVEYAYNQKMTEAQKILDKKLAANKAVVEAKARYEAAKKALKDAKKKYKDLDDDDELEAAKDVKALQSKVTTLKEELRKAVVKAGEAAKALTDDEKTAAKAAAKAKAEEKEKFAEKKQKYEALAEDKRKNPTTDEEKKTVKEYNDAVAAVAEAEKNAAKNAYDARVKEANDEVEAINAKYEKAVADLGVAIDEAKDRLQDLDKNKLTPKAQAFVDYQKAIKEEAEAYAKLGVALSNEKVLEGVFEKVYGELTALAMGVNSIVKLEGSKIVVKEAKEAGKKSVEEAVKALKASIDDNKAAVKSAEFLLQNAPKSVAKVKAKLEAQIVKAKAAITKGEAALAKVEKKMAFIATAYAAEDDVKVEDLEALTKENKESASDINNTIKENEKEQPAVEEEKKPEEKKPEENKPARKAGKNAKTGIAGIAGVAGILAAASVAYAASKRD